MRHLLKYIDKEHCNLKTEKEVAALFEMATIGCFRESDSHGKPQGIEFKVFVNGNDGSIPHVHICDNDGRHFHTCVRLDKAEYLKQEDATDVFTENQIKSFIKFLNSPDEFDSEKTVWEVLLITWNRNNPYGNKLSLDQAIPNYLDLV